MIHDEMDRQLAAEGSTLDAIYYCPEAPRRRPDRDRARRPQAGPGMLLRAGRELGLDLVDSWMVGDMISDVLAGINAGCRGSLLVETGKELIDGEARAAATDHRGRPPGRRRPDPGPRPTIER